MSASWDLPSDDALGDVMPCLEPAALLSSGHDQLTQLQGAKHPAWKHARVVEALYHPGRYVRVAYALLSDESTPERRLWPEADLLYIHAPVRQPISRRGTTLTLEGHVVEAYRFPNDRRLRGLRRFAGSAAAAHAWQAWLDQAGDPFRIDEATQQRMLLRYVPEQKWVVRLRAEGRTEGSSETVKRRIAVRCTRSNVCKELAQRHTALAAASSNAAFNVPAVVGANVDDGVLAVEWNRGDSLVETLGNGSSKEVMAKLAAMLRAFHRATVPGLTRVTSGDLADQACDALGDLSSACPELSDRLASIGIELPDRLASIAAVSPVTLHNDLHWNQVRIKRGIFTLLDLERMTLGDPLIDVANLTSQLRMLEHRPEIDVGGDRARRWANEFLAQWIRCGGEHIDPVRFRCYTACSVLSLARGMMRHLRPGWRNLALRCVDVAESELAALASGVLRR